MQIEIVDSQKDKTASETWENYLWAVASKQRGLAHHSYSVHWQTILHKTFGHRAFYLMAREKQGQGVTGILPLVQVKSKLFGNSLISVPYVNAGGIIADDKASFSALLNKAQELASEQQVRYLELRSLNSYDGLTDTQSNLVLRSHKVSMLLELASSADTQFERFKTKLRSQIRRPGKSGVTTRVVRGHEATACDILDFYKVFSENMRDLGTPVYPQSLFRNTLEAFGERASLVLGYMNKEPIAAGFLIQSGGHMEIPWASTRREYNKLSPNMAMYWEAIKHACDQGCGVFDFGRSSPDSGTFRFKAQWGAEPHKLCWYYHMLKGQPPEVNPKDSKFDLLVRCWQRLPLPVANLLGPTITKSLP